MGVVIFFYFQYIMNCTPGLSSVINIKYKLLHNNWIYDNYFSKADWPSLKC